MNGMSLARGRIVQGFLKWFWRQSIFRMLITTVVVVIGANHPFGYLGFSQSNRHEITTAVGFALLMIAVAACFVRALLGDPMRKR